MIPVLILAGGQATRLGALTKNLPKSLIEVVGQSFAEHQIELLKQSGYTDIFFLVCHLGETISRSLGDGSRFGVQLRYFHDGYPPLGTGGAVSRILELLQEPCCLVLYGDSYLNCDYAGIEAAFWASGKDALMTVYHNHDRWVPSNVSFEYGRIVAYNKERPPAGARYIDYGLGVFRREAFEGLGQPPFDLSAVYQRALGRGQLDTYTVHERFYEIGSPEGLAETRAYLEKKG